MPFFSNTLTNDTKYDTIIIERRIQSAKREKTNRENEATAKWNTS